MQKKAVIIVPAYNEALRIGQVLRAARASRLASGILVVSDGSTDRTAQVARGYPGVEVLELDPNQGKAAAMCAGVAASGADIVVFIDADLVGLRGHHIDQLIRPVLQNECDMSLGVLRGGKFWSDAAQLISPSISGQRAMSRELFESIPDLREQRMGVEVAITTYLKEIEARVEKVMLHGISNCHKETKMGFKKGLVARTRMYVEIGRSLALARKRRKPGRSA